MIAAQPYVAAQDIAVTERSTEDAALVVAIREYEDLVARTEIDEGAFAPVLAEQLVTLGTLLQRSDRHDDAVTVLQRALHVARVNFGLHETRIGTIVNHLIDSHVALKDWKAANEDYGYWIWLQRRGHDQEAPELPSILARYGKWHLDAANLDTGTNPFSHLVTADAAFARAIEGYEQHPDTERQQVIAALHSLALANLRIFEFARSAEDPTTGTFIQDEQLGSPISAQGMEMMRRSELSFRRGRDALLRAITLTEQSGDAAAIATSYTHLADWMLPFGRYGDAEDLYQQAYEKAAAAPQAEELRQKLFVDGTLLPALPVPATEYYPESVNVEDYVMLAVDVSPRGEVIRTRVVEQTAGITDAGIAEAKRYMRVKRIRPRLVNGNIKSVSDVRLRYFPRGGAVRIRP
ncbi:MAG: hypothetical protein IT494_01960 [Gammaproteobacteria bacterium]|nr:hypothetical protein [Gammaproteobacteria bacterium]